MSSSFVHLHVHSEYSLLEASCRIKSTVKKAAAMGMPAMALTDNGNMFGAIEFYFAAQDAGIKPIIGLDAYLAPGSRLEKKQDRDQVQKGPKRLVLLATNYKGYQNLSLLSSISYQEGFYWKPRIDYEVLEKYNSDLICLSGGIRGEVAETFLREGPDAALEKIRNLKRIFDDRFYLEMNRTGLTEWNEINKFLLEASKITGVPVVAANDVHYATQDDQISQEVLVCIGTNKTLHDESRFRLGSSEFYLKSPDEMKHLFEDVPQAIENTLQIAERCNVKFKLKDESGKPIYHLPSYPTAEGVGLKDEMRRMSFEGLELRFKEAEARGEAVSEADRPRYIERLDFELKTIDRMGFNGYFLIVQDFINWAKNHDIPVGPGRGSGAGSLVAYCLRITDLDPFPSNLLFERFLNPERISMPDFDIDFCQDRRQEVIQYVTDKYGRGSVSQIITYGKLQARAAIKDVGRVLGMTFAEVDAVTKLVPEKLGINLKEALELEPRITEMMESNPQVATLMDLAQRVEGLVRHAGIHAAGVIIGDGELVQHAPLYKGADGENVVQYDMKNAEKIGLIKYDFLGLKTLTHINHALGLIAKNRGKKITTIDISLKDPGIYEIMSKGDTAGIFQFEGDGITQVIRAIRPTSFAEITAINALYRPGPMANIPEFTKRKHGEVPIEYPFEQLKEILQETYGIIVYQEQVMGIASLIAGYSLGEADMLRRAMGKKIKEEMDKHRERFLKGAEKNGFDATKANEVFDLMYKFADYGFNKSHSAAYCVLAAQTAWLKNYYPVEFFAALLSTEISNTDNVVMYVKDAQEHGIKVNPPHVNFSDYLFSVNGDEIYFGLGAIKGMGESAVESIIEARQKTKSGKFESLEDFFTTVDIKKLNKRTVEALIKAGALDGFGYHRAQLMSGYQQFMDRAQGVNKDRALGQTSLFDMGEATESQVKLEDCQPWTRTASLSFEKEVLGFYLSDHPLKGFEKIAKLWVKSSLRDLALIAEAPSEDKNQKKTWPRENKKRAIVCGLITEIREVITKKGTRMAFGRLEDLTGSCELVIFPDVYARYEALCKEERPVLIGGGLETEEGLVKIMVDQMSTLEDVMKKARNVVFHLDKLEIQEYEKLNSVLKEYPGSTEVKFQIKLPDIEHDVSLEPEEILKVQVGSDLIESLHSQFGNTDFIELRS